METFELIETFQNYVRYCYINVLFIFPVIFHIKHITKSHQRSYFSLCWLLLKANAKGFHLALNASTWGTLSVYTCLRLRIFHPALFCRPFFLSCFLTYQVKSNSVQIVIMCIKPLQHLSYTFSLIVNALVAFTILEGDIKMYLNFGHEI